MSKNEKKEENNENVSLNHNNDKTTDIINSINAIVIPNVEESSSKSTNIDEFKNNIIKKEETLDNKNINFTESSNDQKINNENFNQLNTYHNQIMPNSNENIIPNINNNHNNININNMNNMNNIGNNNNTNNINFNNDLTNKIINNDNYNINNNVNNNQNISNINFTKTTQNNLNQNFQPLINKNINRKKSNAEKKSGQKGMKELAFKFPLKDSFSKVEIPFAFQQNLDEPNNDSRFHSYITIKDTPKLYIDISDDKKMDKFKLASTIETLKASNQEQENKLKGIDTNIMKFNDDNELLREEIEKVKNEIILRNNEVNKLKQTIQQINQNNSKNDKEMKQKINEKNNSYVELKEHYENIKNEILSKNLNEKEKKEYLTKIQEEINKIQKEYQNNFKYYNNKLNSNNYNDEYIKKCLQKDLIDFTSYVTQKIQIISPKVKELINYIQSAVDSSIGKEFEVRLYGSHATGLCLPWSDIDVVLCKKNGEGIENNSYLPLHELFTYLQKKNDLFKSINYIGTTTVPLIKIKTKENLGIQSVDISLQDKTHYGIKCVSLVLSFKEEYEVLLPMILALKNILKQANLNDPYKVRKNILFYI